MLVVTNDIPESMKENDNVHITWLCNKKNIKNNNNKICLNKDLVRVLLRKISDIGDMDSNGDITVTGYTRATINMDNSSKIICMHIHAFWEIHVMTGLMFISRQYHRMVLRLRITLRHI